MHYFKTVITSHGKVRENIKEINGTYNYAINFMSGYLQALQDSKKYYDADIQVTYIPELEVLLEKQGSE
tara:strand:- start:555 stop:761 length:207 start_codon:yes stop_codon:yes gene_type:complete